MNYRLRVEYENVYYHVTNRGRGRRYLFPDRPLRAKGMKQIPRWVAMKLCQEKSSAKLQKIAKAFNVTHYSTVS